MTRPRALDYDDKKQHILREAARLFGRRGSESTTMNDVAQACGTSKSHLYHYFDGKETLLFAIISEHIHALAGELVAIVEQPLMPEQRFEQLVKAFVERASTSRDEHLVLMHDLKFLSAAQQREIRALETQILDLMVAVLRRINPDLLPSDEVAKPYALMLFGTMIWTFTWYRPEGLMAPGELAARMSETFLCGLQGARGAVGAVPAAPSPSVAQATSLRSRKRA